jgi:hypothetical protein
MSGKGILLLMMGFSMLFMVIANNFHGVSGQMTDNYVDYFNNTTAHNIAVSGANLAANAVFLDPTWTTGYNQQYQNGNMVVRVLVLNAFKNIRQIESYGIFNGDTSVVRVTLAPSKFSKFAYYSISEGSGIWWIDKDTVWGPFHTQDRLRVYRKPTFYGKASSRQGIQYYSSQALDAPYFHGGYESGVDLPLPMDGVTSLKAPSLSGGLYFNGNETGKSTVYMDFDGDYLYYRYNTTSPFDTVHLPSVAPNGLIYVENGTVRMKGTIKGAYTVGVSGTSGTRGSVFLDGDVVYQTDPRVDPTSVDMLGIVAQKQVLITDAPPNYSNISIHASIYAEGEGFGAQNYDSRPVSGNINLLGGIIQNTRKAVGTFSGGGIQSGFAKQYRYDERFLVASPPFFPGTGGYEIVSWYE